MNWVTRSSSQAPSRLEFFLAFCIMLYKGDFLSLFAVGITQLNFLLRISNLLLTRHNINTSPCT
jgi:hypothetical protein